jgi:hypothetical protein
LSDKKLKSLAYRLDDSDSLRRLFSKLNFNSCDEPVNKENWNENQKKFIQEARIIANKNNYDICYIKTNLESSSQLKIISSMIIKEKLGLCLVCIHNPNGNEWIFSSLSKGYTKLFSETRHIPIEIKKDLDVPETFVNFLEKITINNDSTAISIHSQISDAFDEFSLQIHDELTVNVFEAYKSLTEGIVLDKNNNLKLDDETLEDVRSPIFILLYRLIFVLYAESRNIFEIDNSTYNQKFSLEWIKKNWILNSKLVSKLPEYDIQNRIKNLFHLIEVGSDVLELSTKEFSMISYYGRLFDRDIHKELEKWKIPNKQFLDAISFITRTKDKNRNYFFLDYSALKTRHLGSIYEHLLEFHLTVKNNKISELPNPEERVTSASYYTPDYIVDHIVSNSIEPLIIEIIDKNSDPNIQIEKILELKILDPAMGSGHFLIGAVNYIAKRLCEIKYNELKEDKILELKREVVRKCIFGTDLNPLAVELASVALWLETLSHDKPLSFLQAHLKNGNSLIDSKIKQIYDKPTTIMEAQKGISFFKKSVKSVLAFEELDDDDGSVVKAKIQQYKKMQSDGTTHNDLKFLLNALTAQQFGLKIPPLGDFRAKIGEKSLDFYSSDEGPKIKQLATKINFFHWELEFPEIFFDNDGERKSNPGFDAVIGNPPYLSARRMSKIGMDDQKAFFKKSSDYNCAIGIYDLYVVFIEKGIKLVKQGGEFGFIIPNKFMINDYGYELRKFLLNSVKIREIVDVSKENVFNDASVYPHILILSKPKNIPSSYKLQSKIGLKNILSENQISIELFKQMPENIFVINFTDTELDLIKKILGSGKALESSCKLHAGTPGFNATKTGECLVENKSVENNVDFIVTGNIDRYNIVLGNVRYLKKDYKKPKLILNEEVISEGKISLFTSPKIVIGGMTKRIEAAFDNDGVGLGVNVFALTDFEIPKNYLLGLLNSKLITFYFIIINQAKHLAGDYFAINKNQLAKLPIRPFTGNLNEYEITDEISELLKIVYETKKDDQILEQIDKLLIQNKSNVVENIFINIVKKRDETKLIEHFLDELIDKIVYKLYQLSDNQIKILEQKIN